MISTKFRPLLVAGALLLGVCAIAYAHATLVSAEPAQGSHVDKSPAQIRLVFSEALEIPMASVALVDAAGSSIRLTTKADPHNVNAVIALVPNLEPGTYRVDWRVVSDDGHPVSGSYDFTLGATSAAPAMAIPQPRENPGWGPSVLGAPVSPAVLRGLGLIALLVFVGMLGFMAIPVPIAEQLSPPRALLAQRIGFATIALLIFSTIAWILNVTADHSLLSSGAAASLKTAEGTTQWMRIVMTYGAYTILRSGRVRGALLFGAVALLISGASGHAGAISPLIATPAKAIHLVASAAWLGGLVWFVSGGTRDAAALANDARRLSAVAFVAVLLVFISGVVQSFVFLPSLSDLLGTAYGVVILVKVAGFGVLVLFGAQHRYRMMPRLVSDGAMPSMLDASIRREIAVMCIVVLVGGFLAFVPTPARTSAAQSPLALVK